MADEKDKKSTVNINDLSLNQEADGLAVNTDADAFAFAPPPPDDTYVVKLSIKNGAEGWTKDKTRKTNKPYFACAVISTIVQEGGRFDGRKVYDNFVSTLVSDYSGTCRMVGILKAAGVPNEKIRASGSNIELARLFGDTLAGEPLCRLETRWEAQYKTGRAENGKDEYKTFLRGMKKFPEMDVGGQVVHNHVVEAPNGDEVTAQAQPLRYLAVGG